jgi:hypothetical protein
MADGTTQAEIDAARISHPLWAIIPLPGGMGGGVASVLLFSSKADGDEQIRSFERMAPGARWSCVPAYMDPGTLKKLTGWA